MGGVATGQRVQVRLQLELGERGGKIEPGVPQGSRDVPKQFLDGGRPYGLEHGLDISFSVGDVRRCHG